VTVNTRAVKPNHRLHLGEVVQARCDLPARSSDATLTPQAIPLEIVHEDDAVLVVHKPAGLVTHPAPGHWDGTLVNAILWHFHHAKESRLESALARAGIVHRLDKDTSGLLLVAKTAMAHTVLSRQLKARTIQRRYLALVEGHVPMDEGTVTAPLGRHLAHRKQMTVRHLGGRHAVTHYRVLHRLHSPQPPAWRYTVLEVSLETGRTHQSRVHMAHLGYPILGDATYGRHSAGYWAEQHITRQLLHAYAIRFAHPVTRAPVMLTVDPPADIRRWLPQEA
jgi:23S rRNA pseudouridine1911/1915/1917 synthase